MLSVRLQLSFFLYLARPIMCVSDFEGQGATVHLRHGQQPEGPAGIKGQPTLHPFWAAGFSFARGHFVIQIPYDEHLPMVFQGEYMTCLVQPQFARHYFCSPKDLQSGFNRRGN